MARAKTIGNRIAPARFLLFFAMLAASITLATLMAPWWRSVMLGFDASALVFILGCVPLYRASPEQIRATAAANDANRTILLFLSFALAIVILVAVGSELGDRSHTGPVDVAITISTLLMAWFFANVVFALHYAHLFYSADDGGEDHAGIVFPLEKGKDSTPIFSDFVYLSFTIGSALSVSDTNVTSAHIRRVVTNHTIAAFIFNVGVFALTVNMLAGNH